MPSFVPTAESIRGLIAAMDGAHDRRALLDALPDNAERGPTLDAAIEFLARLLLRLGADATLVDPPEALDAVAAVQARILERYRATESAAGRGTMAPS